MNYGIIYAGITANTAGAHTGFLAFYTATAGGTSEKMRITTGGLVGNRPHAYPAITAFDRQGLQADHYGLV